jgi:hypothetical protein
MLPASSHTMARCRGRQGRAESSVHCGAFCGNGAFCGSSALLVLRKGSKILCVHSSRVRAHSIFLSYLNEEDELLDILSLEEMEDSLAE